MKVKPSSLTQAIKGLYPVAITATEENEAACNLLVFMELLIEIDMEHGISCASESGRQP